MENAREPNRQPAADKLREYELALCSAATEFTLPLELISWNQYLLRRHMAENGPAYSQQLVGDSLRDIHAATVQLERMVDNFTQLCACLCGSVPVQQAGLDLASLLHSICADHEAIYRAVGVELAARFDAGALWYTVGDPVLAERVLLHLLSNALRACDRGGRVEFRLSSRKGEILLCVQDSGCGLTEERFRAALQLANPEKEDRFRGGTGLGLFLCAEYCRLLGWKMELQPVEQGTCLCLIIPERRAVAGQLFLHSPQQTGQTVSRRALLRTLQSVPGLQDLDEPF